MRILCKKKLCFSMPDGRRCVVKPFAVETVPDWVTKSKMWEFAMLEDGLISILNEAPMGVGAETAPEEPAAEEAPAPAKKTRKKKEEPIEAEITVEEPAAEEVAEK